MFQLTKDEINSVKSQNVTLPDFRFLYRSERRIQKMNCTPNSGPSQKAGYFSYDAHFEQKLAAPKRECCSKGPKGEGQPFW